MIPVQCNRGHSQHAYKDVVLAHGGTLSEAKSLPGRQQRVWLGQLVDLSPIMEQGFGVVECKPGLKVKITNMRKEAEGLTVDTLAMLLLLVLTPLNFVVSGQLLFASTS